jgi:catechol 2,3-dioxygenase-like lactoylglutathione lyase family enzyme
MKLELVAVPVTDVDRAKAFYVDQVGFHAESAAESRRAQLKCTLGAHLSTSAILTATLGRFTRHRVRPGVSAPSTSCEPVFS